MTRPLRSTFPYGFWHITSRGVDGRLIFMDEDDRNVFLHMLQRVIPRFGWRCHAYCLMSNHYHLVIECGQPALSDGMERLNGLYASYVNQRHGRVGHLFQRRFESRSIQDERYLESACRYVLENPVRARLCAQVVDWPWSGLRAPTGPSRTAALRRAARPSSPAPRPDRPTQERPPRNG
ncbi:MAG: transposase [Actinobacteria bacterium]|nr:transposase [Actinomycetota bacterium]